MKLRLGGMLPWRRDVTTPPVATRERAEPVLSTRRYAGARFPRSLEDWRGSFGSADSELRQTSLRMLRARWRDLAENNEYVSGFGHTLTRNVVGPNGIQVGFKVYKNRKTGEIDRDRSLALGDLFEDFADVGNCTADGKWSLVDATNTWLWSLVRDGEDIVRSLPGYDNAARYAVQMLEGDYLDETYNLDLADDARIRMSVEMNGYGKPLAYHLFRRHPGDWAGAPYYGATGRVRVPAEQITHAFIAERHGQTRGVPYGHAAMIKLRHAGKGEEYALIAMRTGAAKMGFYETSNPGGMPTEGEQKTDDGDLIQEVEPGSIERLPPGTVFKAHNPDYPRGDFAPFMKAMLRGGAIAMGSSYPLFGNDLEGSSYSSIRVGTLEDRDQYRVWQVFTIAHFLKPAVVWPWLEMQALTGAIDVPFHRLRELVRPIFRPRGWQWVDPRNEAEGATRALALKIESRSRLAAARGYDFEEILEENADDARLAAEYGVELVDPIPAGSVAKPAASEVASPPGKGALPDDGQDEAESD